MTLKQLTLSLLLGASVWALTACGGQGGPGGQPDAKAEAEEEAAVPVETAIVARGDVAASYSGTATLETEKDAEVVAKVGGVIEEILVEEGQRVEKDQLLARIDDDRLRLEVARAEANLAKLEQEYRRNKELHQRQLISAEVYERLGFEMQAMRTEVELARLQLDWTEIRAPFDGVVAQRHIKIGNMISQNAAAFRVTAFDPLLAKLYVPEGELNKLRTGQKANIRVDALPGAAFAGKVDRVSPVVDAGTGTFTVTVEVHDTENQLKPGMFGRINIIYDVRENTLLAPRAAIITEDAQSSVFVIRDGHAQRQNVKLGYTTNGSIEILEGLQQGDEIVTIGQNTLKDGAKVAVIGAIETTPSEPPKEDTKVAGADPATAN